MSRGTRVVPVRLPPGLVHLVELTIELRNQNSREEPWTFSDFVRRALEEKIRKMERSRRRPIVLENQRQPVPLDEPLLSESYIKQHFPDQDLDGGEDSQAPVAKPGANS